jgi:hypothetical protein
MVNMKQKVILASAFIFTAVCVIVLISWIWAGRIAADTLDFTTLRQIQDPLNFLFLAFILGFIGLIIMYIGILLPLKKKEE